MLTGLPASAPRCDERYNHNSNRLQKPEPVERAVRGSNVPHLIKADRRANQHQNQNAQDPTNNRMISDPLGFRTELRFGIGHGRILAFSEVAVNA